MEPVYDRTTAYTSSNPIGKGMEVIISDIDNDGFVRNWWSAAIIIKTNDDYGSAYEYGRPAYFTISRYLAWGLPETRRFLLIGFQSLLRLVIRHFVYDDPVNNWTTPYNDPAVIADVYARRPAM